MDMICFPAFWLLLFILVMVLAMFFVIVAKDQSGNIDWRQANKNIEENSLKSSNSIASRSFVD
jgi:high-affinity Fe2+/Pb2+ permease